MGRSVFVGTPECLSAQATMQNSKVSNLEDAYLTMVDSATAIAPRDH